MKKIIFFGELPPFSLNGVSVSNDAIISILKDEFSIYSIVESRNTSVKYNSLVKILFTLKDIFKFAVISCKGSFDIFYASMPSSFSGSLKIFILIRILKLFRFQHACKIILHIHRGDFYRVSINNQLVRFISKLIFNQSNCIISLSDSQNHLYYELGASFVLSLPNTVLHSPNVLQNSRGNEFIFLSNYIEEKGIKILLDSIAILKNSNVNISVALYGGGDFSDFLFYAKSLGLTNVTFNGPILDDEKFSRLSNTRALIFPSLNEGQPIVILEAMLLGTPIITTNIGLIEEMLGAEYPHICKANSAEALSECIYNFMRISDTSMLSSYLRSRFESNYNLNSYRLRVLDIFSQVGGL